MGAPLQVMIIRHAEKPSDDGTITGVNAAGRADAEDLVVQGWQRAGALARFFAPLVDYAPQSQIQRPKAIFASAVGPQSQSLRPQHTVGPLSKLTGLPVQTPVPAGDETALAPTVLAADGPVLIAWHHEAIPDLIKVLTGVAGLCPAKWPKGRFDLVWLLDRPSAAAPWIFSQAAQLLLDGDGFAPN